MWRAMAATPIVSTRYLRTEGSPFGMGEILRDALECFLPEERIHGSDAELLVSTTRARRFALRALPFGRGSTRNPGDALVIHSSRARRDMHAILLASCYIPVLYAKIPRIDGEIHVDGGATDNTLLKALIARGAEDITVVTPYLHGAVSDTLFTEERTPEVPTHVRLRLISPVRALSLGRFDFSPRLLEEALTMPHVEEIFEAGVERNGAGVRSSRSCAPSSGRGVGL